MTITPALTWADVAWFRSITRLPVVLKGVLFPLDAALAVQAGVAAVWLSNHGGRQLDGVGAGLDALPACVAAMRAAEAASASAACGTAAAGGPAAPRRPRVEVWVDGGVRRGTDILKALALGADFVFLGRPPLWGLAVGGEAGVQQVLELLSAEVRTAMQLLGVVTVRGITAEYVTRRGPLPVLPLPVQQAGDLYSASGCARCQDQVQVGVPGVAGATSSSSSSRTIRTQALVVPLPVAVPRL